MTKEDEAEIIREYQYMFPWVLDRGDTKRIMNLKHKWIELKENMQKPVSIDTVRKLRDAHLCEVNKSLWRKAERG